MKMDLHALSLATLLLASSTTIVTGTTCDFVPLVAGPNSEEGFGIDLRMHDDGTAHIVQWQKTETSRVLRYLRTGPEGNIERTGLNSTFEAQNQARVDQDSNGFPWLAFATSTKEVVTRRRTSINSEWDLEIVATGLAAVPNIGFAVGPDDRATLMVTDGQVVRLYRSSPEGGWTSEVLATGAFGECDLKIDNTGRLHVCYRGEGHNAGLHYGFRDVGGPWTSELIVSNGADYPQLAVGLDGLPHIVYQWDGKVFYAFRSGTNEWTNEAIEMSQFGKSQDIAIFQSVPHIVLPHRDDNSLVLFRKIDDDWQECIVEDEPGVGRYVAMGVTTAGIFGFAYQDVPNLGSETLRYATDNPITSFTPFSDAPAHDRSALKIQPSPAALGDPVSVVFELPRTTSAVLEVFLPDGRAAVSKQLGRLRAGSHRARILNERSVRGVLFVRVSWQGGASVGTLVVR